MLGGLPVPRLGRLQVARGGRLGAGSCARPGARAHAPTRRSTLVAAAQRPDGYLNTFVQVARRRARYRDLRGATSCTASATSIQAAVAWQRALGDDRLLEVAMRAVGPRRPGARAAAGATGSTAIPRSRWRSSSCTGPPASGATSSWRACLIDRRGQACSAPAGSGRATGRTTRPSATRRRSRGTPSASCTSTAVRSTWRPRLGDDELLEAVIRRWRDMVATRTYLTGGLGSRHRDEAFGDPFELPPDRAYTETCAAIASVMLAWRLLLATGDPACADAIERTHLQRRAARAVARRDALLLRQPAAAPDGPGRRRPGDGERAPWYPVRLLPAEPDAHARARGSSASRRRDRTGSRCTSTRRPRSLPTCPAATARLAIETDYPWDGRVGDHRRGAAGAAVDASLRVPGWCRTASLAGPDEGDGRPAAGGATDRAVGRSGRREPGAPATPWC